MPKTKSKNTLSLESLPPKVAKPLLGLTKLGFIDNDDIECLMLSKELSGTTHTLLGFTVAYFSMKSSGYIKDTLRMAKDLNRRVNLGWSRRRWIEEHDKMSRIMTFKKLAEDNVGYDVSRYVDSLPSDWSGYLIKSKRRLALEGYRQKHCVASYHNSILNGYCAIATVFYNRVRWTVELRFMPDKQELCISQIKSVGNKTASAEQRVEIAKILNIDPNAKVYIQMHTLETRTRQELCHLFFRDIRPVLAQTGIDTIQIDFSGGGDSGNIDSASYHDSEGKLHYFRNEHQGIDRQINEWAEEYIETADVDWYNNDGGSGCLKVENILGRPNTDLSIDVFYTDSSNEFGESLDLESGEPI